VSTSTPSDEWVQSEVSTDARCQW